MSVVVDPGRARAVSPARHRAVRVPSGPTRRTRVATFVRRRPFELLVGLASTLYTALALSPSSYALALGAVGAHPSGSPYLGTPRAERWDEWAVQTPYVQAVVRSGFADVDTTSFYRESFRNLVALPVMDAGFALRPLSWGYAVLPPAWAFSLCWALCAFGTLVGWHLLFERLGVRYLIAAAASLALFFSPFVQTWWTGLAPLLALFPWIVLVVGARGRLWWRVPVLAWLVASWVVSTAYLPGLVLLAFVGLVLVGGFLLRRSTVVATGVLALAALVGGGVGALYLRPVLGVLAHTSYPGGRVVAGGHLPAVEWLGQLAPFATTQGFRPLLTGYLPEAVALGSFLPLLALATTDLRRVRRECRRRELRPLAVVLGAFLLLTAWQLVPAAGSLGAVFGWNRSEEQRSLMAGGPLLLLAAAWAMSQLPQRAGARRVAGFAALAVVTALLGGVLLGMRTLPAVLGAARDGLVAAGVAVGLGLVVVLIGRRRPDLAVGLLALAVVVPTAAVWATYNPVQDSRAVFRPVDTPYTRTLDAAAARRPDHVIDAPGPGAVLTGLGYRSVFTVLPLPQLATFRALYPELPESELNRIFNRYVELVPVDESRPRLIHQGVVGLPRDVLRRVDDARARGTGPG